MLSLCYYRQQASIESNLNGGRYDKAHNYCTYLLRMYYGLMVIFAGFAFIRLFLDVDNFRARFCPVQTINSEPSQKLSRRFVLQLVVCLFFAPKQSKHARHNLHIVNCLVHLFIHLILCLAAEAIDFNGFSESLILRIIIITSIIEHNFHRSKRRKKNYKNLSCPYNVKQCFFSAVYQLQLTFTL